MTWGRDLWDQFDNIGSHTLRGIEFCDKFSQFIKERCLVENEYAAKLKKLVKNYQPKKKEEDAEWTSVRGFSAMITEIHDIAGQHEMIADNLNNLVFKELQNLAQLVKQERKKQQLAGQKQLASLQAQLQALDKSKKQYEKSFKEAEKAQELYKKADADKHMSKADVEKAQNIMLQKQQNCEDCKNDYASELQKTNECQSQHYNHAMPVIFDQIQEMEEKRIAKVKDLLMSCADVEKGVLPIINTCIQGMVKAADSVSCAEDSQAVIDKYKSGFIPPDDIRFEDLSNPSVERLNHSTPSATSATSRLDPIRTSFSGGSMKAKRKTRLLNIFSGSKTDESKDDYSHLPPNQQKKKLNQRISVIKNSLAKETAERDGMLKMQDVYKQNPALGDPQSLSKQLDENGQKLDKLRLELQKYENYLHEAENGVNNLDPKSRYSTSLQGSPISISRANSSRSSSLIQQNNNSSLSVDKPDSNRVSSQSAADQDSFDDIDDEVAADDGLMKPIGKCSALYPFDAPSEGSMSMFEGEEFLIMEHDQGDGWMRVRRVDSAEEGFVPTSYVEIYKNFSPS